MQQSVRKTPARLGWCLLAAVVIGLPALAYTQSLSEKQQRKRNSEILQQELKDMNTACKTGVRAAWDWPSFKGKVSDKDLHHVASNCSEVLNAMENMCNSEPEVKEAVRAGVKTFVCRGDRVRSVQLNKKSKTLTVATNLDPETKKNFDIAEYLRQNL